MSVKIHISPSTHLDRSPVPANVTHRLIQAFNCLNSQGQGQELRSHGQELKVSRPRLRTWILALRTKDKAKNY